MNNKLQLTPIDLKWVSDNFDIPIFGNFESHNHELDINLSKMLLLDGSPIAYCLVKRASILQTIKHIIYWVKDGRYSALKFFVDRNFLKKYKSKRGILLLAIYVSPEHRNRGYSDILIKYCKSIGDYMWGIAIKNHTDEFWKLKGKEIVCNYTTDDGDTLSIFTDKI